MVFLVGFPKENNTEHKIENLFIGLDYQPLNMDPAELTTNGSRVGDVSTIGTVCQSNNVK